jgi:hypothetical protein
MAGFLLDSGQWCSWHQWLCHSLLGSVFMAAFKRPAVRKAANAVTISIFRKCCA